MTAEEQPTDYDTTTVQTLTELLLHNLEKRWTVDEIKKKLGLPEDQVSKAINVMMQKRWLLPLSAHQFCLNVFVIACWGHSE